MVDWGRWGLESGWHSVRGQWMDAPESTLEALASLLGKDRFGDGAVQPEGLDAPLWVLVAGERPEGGPSWELFYEDGSSLQGGGLLPGDMPLGYHRLVANDGRKVTVVVAPQHCHLPADLRGWLWTLQAYALRSEASWGIGDLADVRLLGSWAKGEGASMLMLNPLHAGPPGPYQQDSPYSPSSRIWRNPIYLHIEEVPGAEHLGSDLQGLAQMGRELNAWRQIDRNAAWRIKSQALERIFAATRGSMAAASSPFAAWRESKGKSLQAFATYCAIAESYGPNWLDWPAGLGHPDSPGVAEEARSKAGRVEYHAWLQWVTELQLDAAAAQIPLLMDLAVGTDPGGADAWVWQDCFAHGARIGAPPDDFNSEGQDWGLVPYHPQRLREAGFAPFIEALRANLRPGGGLRVDHVMGLWRQWWIPPGTGAARGAYVRFPHTELLRIVALESVRAGAVVVGEDLGVVEPEVRQTMASLSLLSSKVAIFEPGPPSEWGDKALGSFSTHDLPTLGGLLGGTDLEDQRSAGMVVEEGAAESMRAKIRSWAQSDDPAEAAVSMAGQLGASRCALVAMSLEDALGVPERPNMPGTVGTWPNWRLALPLRVEEVIAAPQVKRVADAFTQGRSQPPGH